MSQEERIERQKQQESSSFPVSNIQTHYANHNNHIGDEADLTPEEAAFNITTKEAEADTHTKDSKKANREVTNLNAKCVKNMGI